MMSCGKFDVALPISKTLFGELYSDHATGTVSLAPKRLL
jgi:hypothetical protein